MQIKGTHLALIFFSLITAVFFGVILFFQRQSRFVRPAVSNGNINQITETVKESPTPATPSSSLISPIDETWNLYTNKSLGISLKVPITFLYKNGGCEFNESPDFSSYRTVPAFTPTKIIETANSLVIVNDYFFKLDDESSAGIGEEKIRRYGSCGKFETAYEDINKPNSDLDYWKIVVGDAANDEDLQNKISGIFGPNCKAGEKMASPKKSIFDVRIIENGDCDLKGNYEIKYSKDLSKFAAWKKNDNYTFWKNDNSSYDSEISESIEFLPK